MDERSFALETPIGSVRSDSGSHALDIASVVGVIAVLWIGKIIMKRIIK